jgi:hypothetical protein
MKVLSSSEIEQVAGGEEFSTLECFVLTGAFTGVGSVLIYWSAYALAYPNTMSSSLIYEKIMGEALVCMVVGGVVGLFSCLVKKVYDRTYEDVGIEII